jgi:serine/threonine protein kinase
VNRPIPFGKYYLLERINVGGMAEVFRAKAYGVEGFERLLAVKRILPNIAADEEFIEMFIDEAKIAVQLNHANIAQIFDLGKVEDAYFIALEYVHGKDLRAIFDRGRALTETMPVPQACFVVMKICEGLDYAHNKRDASGREMHLVHRDVSPQNVLCSYDGEVKLVDFGIAKAAGKASKTQAGILKGKFGYMSPEQVRGLPLDRRSDIFSVGIILYELLTNERLFLGETDFATLEKVRNVEILPPTTYNRRISDELEQIVMRALAKDVEDRYQNAIDLHDDLQAYMYTSGEFYSRKDLAAWMKRTFAKQIEEEDRKLEAYRQMPIPEPEAEDKGESPPVSRSEPTRDFAPERRPGAEMAPGPADDSAVGAPALTWDDDEIDTQIYDKVGDVPDAAVTAPSEAAPGDSAPLLPRTTGPISPPKEVLEPAHPGQLAAAAAASAAPSATVAPMPSAPPSPPRRRRAAPLIVVAALAFVVSTALLYYFLIFAKRPGTLTLKSTPIDVQFFIDGHPQPKSTSPLVKDLPPGVYSVAARAQGYQSWERSVQVAAGQPVEVTATLIQLPSVELRTNPPGAQAWLDKKKLSQPTPIRITHIKPGRHSLEVRLPPVYQPTMRSFEVQAGQNLKLTVQLLPRVVAVSISSDPLADAFLVRDGHRQRLGQTPINAMKLDPKLSYRVELKKDGYKDWSEALLFKGAKPINLKISLKKLDVVAAAKPTRNPSVSNPRVRRHKKRPVKPRKTPKKTPPTKVVTNVVKPPVKPVAQPKGKGWLLINSRPWTRIAIDGRNTGLTTPQKRIPLPAGKHTITLKNEKFGVTSTFTVLIQPNRGTKVIKRFN